MWELLGDLFPRPVAFLLSIIALFSPGIMNKVDLTVTNEITTKTEELNIEMTNHTGSTIGTEEYNGTVLPGNYSCSVIFYVSEADT